MALQTDGNSLRVPATKYNNATLPNITSNDLITEENFPSTTRTTNQSIITHVAESSFGQGKTTQRNFSSSTTIPATTGTMQSPRTHLATNLSSTLFYNASTVSPSHVVVNHHFSLNILDYVLIPVGSLIAVVVSCFLVSTGVPVVIANSIKFVIALSIASEPLGDV